MNLRASSRRAAVLAFALVCGVVATQALAHAQKKFDLSADKGVNYQTFKDSGGRFDLEYPAKDWSELEVGGCTLVIFERNDRTATVVVEQERLVEPLGPSEIATNAQIEIDGLKEQQPTAKDFQSELIDTNAGRGAVIRYARPGKKGPERVIRFSIAIGRDLYRVAAIVPERSLAKLEPTLLHIMDSFKISANPAGAKK
jgi:hypothetical protein